MGFTKSSWFVAGVVAGSIAIAAVVLIINNGSLSPKTAQAESQGYAQRQIEQKTLKLLGEASRFFKNANEEHEKSSSGANDEKRKDL